MLACFLQPGKEATLKRFFKLCSQPSALRIGDAEDRRPPVVADPANRFMNSAAAFKWDTLAERALRLKDELESFFRRLCTAENWS